MSWVDEIEDGFGWVEDARLRRTGHALAVDGSAVEVVDTLARHAKRKSLALVGHEPSMGVLAARLIGQRRPLAFKKGAVACIEVDALPVTRPGTLQWFLPPRLLRQLAGKKG
mgnify:CR=1 FL=1